MIVRPCRLILKDPETLVFAFLAFLALPIPIVGILRLATTAQGQRTVNTLALLVGAHHVSGPLDYSPLPYLVFFLLMFFCFGVGSAMNFGVAACVIGRIKGGSPNLWTGLRAVARHGYAAFLSGLMGGAVTTLAAWLGRKFREPWFVPAGIVTWTQATLFVVPIMVAEEKGFWQALPQSVALVKKYHLDPKPRRPPPKKKEPNYFLTLLAVSPFVLGFIVLVAVIGWLPDALDGWLIHLAAMRGTRLGDFLRAWSDYASLATGVVPNGILIGCFALIEGIAFVLMFFALAGTVNVCAVYLWLTARGESERKSGVGLYYDWEGISNVMSSLRP
jgi:hypothetical protein